jgi:tRNA-splicing ligase RtcB
LKTLSPITPYCWRFKENSQVQLYADETLLLAMDEKVKEQIQNVAQLPGLVGCAMTMPDAHWGYGFPIGGVAAFDADAGGIISAGGVGFDISCGIRNLRTNLCLDDILPHAEPLAHELMQAIPAGVGVDGSLKLDIHELDQVMYRGAEWAISQGYGEPEDLLYIEEKGRMKGAEPENVSELAKKRQRGEMGTLGSGNHYLEIQIVDKIYDQKKADYFGIHENQVLISIHCGSRGLGHQIGTDYLIRLAKAANRLGIHLPDRELASAPIHSPEGKQYIGAMRAAINCALANRQILTHLTRDVFTRILPNAKLETLFDVSHNTCKVEKHIVEGQERLLYIHRKGATRAFGPGHPDLPQRYQLVGQPVIIGGSMGTSSYVLAGNPPGLNHAFASASHGAGRAMSRTQALKQWSGKQLVTELAANGILIRSRSMRGIAEEAPNAYKDVDKVAEVTEKAGLARRVARLRPKICIKG